MKLQQLIDFMETICPPELAEDWDNVGLLLGSRTDEVKKVLTCLTIDGAVVDEAVAERVVTTVAIGCGAADEFIAEASRQGADAILMGEARFHACEEARARGIGVVLAGHYATERFSAYVMAERIARKFPELTVEASKRESDPIRIV